MSSASDRDELVRLADHLRDRGLHPWLTERMHFAASFGDDIGVRNNLQAAQGFDQMTDREIAGANEMVAVRGPK